MTLCSAMLAALLVAEGTLPASAPAAGPPAPAQPADAGGASTVKNLFLPAASGRPSTAEETENVVTEVSPAGGLVLTGLVALGDEHQALLEDKEKHGFVFLSEGDRLGSWRVERVEMTRLVLRREGSDDSPLVVELGGTVPAGLPAGGEGGAGAPPGSVPVVTPPGLKSVEERMRERARRERERLGVSAGGRGD